MSDIDHPFYVLSVKMFYIRHIYLHMVPQFEIKQLAVSFFQHPFYPAGGSVSHASNLVNLPVPAYTKGPQVRELVSTQWLPRLEAYRPEMIFISAGFDAHRDDDLGQMGLLEADFAWMTARIKAIADRHAQGRIVSCLEGGYNLDALARSVEAHIRVLADL